MRRSTARRSKTSGGWWLENFDVEVLAEAAGLLRAQLADGPKSGFQIEAAAEKADIAKAELIRATDALGVRCRRGQWWLPG
jgi:hypothetical protein